jgi:hypothetical protein
VSIESDQLRALYFSGACFGARATYRTVAGAAVSISGILDAPYDGVGFGGRVDTSDRDISFFCRESDLPDDAAGGNSGDTLTVNALTYRVASIEMDGAGIVRLRLGIS